MFIIFDSVLSGLRFQNPYYLIHSVHNALIVWHTAPDVLATFTDFHALDTYSPNLSAAAIVFALHIYHIIVYREKLRFDDWLHHVLMIGVALPLGVLLPSSTFLGYSLFFSTGLPGGIDYFLLFLTRNGCLSRMTEKRVNRILNVWVRSPGCVSHAALTSAFAASTPGPIWIRGLSLLPALLMYWNGQYFMEQVVWNLAQLEESGNMHEP